MSPTRTTRGSFTRCPANRAERVAAKIPGARRRPRCIIAGGRSRRRRCGWRRSGARILRGGVAATEEATSFRWKSGSRRIVWGVSAARCGAVGPSDALDQISGVHTMRSGIGRGSSALQIGASSCGQPGRFWRRSRRERAESRCKVGVARRAGGAGDYARVRPPFTTMVCPVMKSARRDAKNTTVAATSSGRPTLRSATILR